MSKNCRHIFTLQPIDHSSLNELITNYRVRYICYYSIGDILTVFVLFHRATTRATLRRIVPLMMPIEVELTSEVIISQFIGNDNFMEHGARPMTRAQKGQIEKDRWQAVVDLAKADRIDEIDPKIRLQHYDAIIQLRNNNRIFPPQSLLTLFPSKTSI